MADDESSADTGATEGAARKVDSGGSAWSLEYDVPGKGWTNAVHMTAEDHLAIADLLKSGALPASFLRKVGEYPMPPDIPAGLRDLGTRARSTTVASVNASTSTPTDWPTTTPTRRIHARA